MRVIDKIKERAKQNIKTICLPESFDKRTVVAASKAIDEGIANIILIGDKDEIVSNNKDVDLSKIKFVNPKEFDKIDEYANLLAKLREKKGMTFDMAKELLLKDPLYFGAVMVKSGDCDGMVAGAVNSTANVLRASLQVLKTAKNTKIVSAFFLMEVPDCDMGENGTFVFGDSGLVQSPTADELSEIAISSAKSFESLVGAEPKVAMLSHSTKGSAKHDDVTKVVEATKLLKEKAPNLKADGELQLDAAIVPEVAISKAPNSDVAGKANVLIFPDLDAGNIGYKLVQRLAKANAYGPLTQGLGGPVNDLSRGCNSDDIVGVIAITAVQAIAQEN